MKKLRIAKKAKFSKKIILLIILLCFIVLGFSFLETNFFKVHKVGVTLNRIGCTDERSIREQSGLLSKNIFLLNSGDLKNIKQKFICIKDIKLTDQLPDKIKLDVKGREAMVNLLSVSEPEASTSSLIENNATPSASINNSYLSDDEGVIFSKGNIENLPKIYVYNKSVSIGSKLDDQYLNKTLNILKVLKSLNLDNSKLYIFNNILVSKSNPEIVFKLDQDQEIQIASLQLILQKAKIDNKQLEFIDLRFDKPVIRFAPKKNG